VSGPEHGLQLHNSSISEARATHNIRAISANIGQQYIPDMNTWRYDSWLLRYALLTDLSLAIFHIIYKRMKAHQSKPCLSPLFPNWISGLFFLNMQRNHFLLPLLFDLQYCALWDTPRPWIQVIMKMKLFVWLSCYMNWRMDGRMEVLKTTVQQFC